EADECDEEAQRADPLEAVRERQSAQEALRRDGGRPAATVALGHCLPPSDTDPISGILYGYLPAFALVTVRTAGDTSAGTGLPRARSCAMPTIGTPHFVNCG